MSDLLAHQRIDRLTNVVGAQENRIDEIADGRKDEERKLLAMMAATIFAQEYANPENGCVAGETVVFAVDMARAIITELDR